MRRIVIAVLGCAAMMLVSVASAMAATCPSRASLVPRSGVYFGASLNWGTDSLSAYAGRLGHRPAVSVYFVNLPMTGNQPRLLDQTVDLVRANGGILLLTLQPERGLAAVTTAVAVGIARRLAAYNRRGVPVIVRFAHEMNGSWYRWSQQPIEYVAAFRRVAAAVHRLAHSSAMLWAPNYGGGYPFATGRYHATPGSADTTALDTNHDGVLTQADDPYAPYWPGDDAVDWVGMTLYHFGNVYPWGKNVVPEPGKFVAELTGTYNGLNGNESAVPDFYAEWAAGHHKPMAIPETAALYAPGRGGASELSIKQAWWSQVFSPDIPRLFPLLKMINWFEWDKYETEINGRVNWTATETPAVRTAFRAALPSWLQYASAVPTCG